jgi:hypothetical protein
MFSSLIVTVALSVSIAFGEPISPARGRQCGTDISNEQKAAAEAHFQANMVDSFSTSATVNVHFHVIDAGDELQQGNIPDSQIEAQMKVLNDDFQGTDLSFKLVNTTRTRNAEWFNSLGPDSEYEKAAKTMLRVGGAADLNVYTVGFNSGSGTGLLGYTVFPEWYADDPIGDGVVILYSSLPGGTAVPYDLGRTLTHEVGHWVGLYHTFQGGCEAPGDEVSDTPPTSSPAFGCPVGRDTCGDSIPDATENYMDYTDDACMNQFSPGQATRFWKQLATYRGL